ncbi:MAG: hypothetical protein ACYTG5_00180 [Planctomycetota bacterium]|jgi:hypothetical protein
MTMMRVYLWKEWQVFRPTLIALSLMALLVCPALLLMPVDWIPGDYVGKVTVCAMLAISVTIGAELLPYERSGKRMEFLGRLPAGEGMAFRAKLLFLMLSLIGFTLLCYLIAQASTLVLKPGFSSPMEQTHLVIVAAGIITSLWAFAISSWISRATLVLPILALFLAFGIKPLMSSDLIQIWNGIGLWHLMLYLLLMTGGAVMLGWVCYLHRLGKARGRKLKPGLLAGAFMVLPWGLASWEAESWVTPRPYSDGFRIKNALVGPDNKHAFLTTRTEKAPHRGLIVDLEDGSWRVVGEPESWFNAPGMLEDGGSFTETTGEHEYVTLAGRSSDITLFDGRSTKPFDFGRPAELYARNEDRLRRSKERTSPIALLDGRKAWIMNRALETLDANDRVEHLGWSFFSKGRAGTLKGLGIRIFNGGLSSMIDLVREKVYPLQSSNSQIKLVLQEGWLRYDLDDRIWLLEDPETGETRPAPGLQLREQVVQVLPDQRILTFLGNQIYALDLSNGEREELQHPEGNQGIRLHQISARANIASRKPGALSTPVLRFNYWDRKQNPQLHVAGIAALNSSCTGFRMLIEGYFQPISFPSDNIMLAVTDRKRIERINLDTGEREILFPRD